MCIRDSPRGVPQVEVTFDIDANGILNVKAKDKATGKEQAITIQGSTGLNKEEVERMTKEAEAHAEEDRAKREEIEVKNTADSLIYTSEKTLKDAGDKVDAALKTEVEEKTKALKDLLPAGSTVDIKAKTEELSSVLQKVGQAMYQESQAPGDKPGTEDSSEEPAKAEGSDEPKKDGPVEGEVVS